MAEEDYSRFTDKRVVVVYNLEEPDAEGHAASEIEGTVQAANSEAILIKPKGKTTPSLILTSMIESIEYVNEKPKELKAKVLKEVDYGTARSHLLERHGYTLSEINKVSEKEALEVHSLIDHVAAGLGHVHGNKAAQAAAEAAEKADAAA